MEGDGELLLRSVPLPKLLVKETIRALPRCSIGWEFWWSQSLICLCMTVTVGCGNWTIKLFTIGNSRTTLGEKILPPPTRISSLWTPVGEPTLLLLIGFTFGRKFWGSIIFVRDKICLWCIVNHDYFHHLRAQIWGVHSGTCPYCNSLPESINHMFFNCCNLKWRWDTLAVMLAGSPLARVFAHDSLWGIICLGVLRAKRNPIPLVWKECNSIQG